MAAKSSFAAEFRAAVAERVIGSGRAMFQADFEAIVAERVRPAETPRAPAPARSPETVERLRDAAKRQWEGTGESPRPRRQLSPEARQKIADAQRRRWAKRKK